MITGIRNTQQRQNFGMAARLDEGVTQRLAELAIDSPRKARKISTAFEETIKEQSDNALYDISMKLDKEGKVSFYLKAKNEKMQEHANDLAESCRTYWIFGTRAGELRNLSALAKGESDNYKAGQEITKPLTEAIEKERAAKSEAEAQRRRQAFVKSGAAMMT